MSDDSGYHWEIEIPMRRDLGADQTIPVWVEPAFKPELGDLFIKVGAQSMWLTREEWEAIKAAGDAALTWKDPDETGDQ